MISKPVPGKFTQRGHHIPALEAAAHSGKEDRPPVKGLVAVDAHVPMLERFADARERRLPKPTLTRLLHCTGPLGSKPGCRSTARAWLQARQLTRHTTHQHKARTACTVIVMR